MYALRIPTGVWNGLLIVLSLSAGLAVCEAALRLADTRYEQAAEPPLRQYRWPNMGPHPDARTEHEVLYNRFGNRQHRDFSERDFQDGMHVAVFGDSFTEGLGVPVQYTFVEVLDHLLNALKSRAAAPAVRAEVHVHNFGMFGTGPGSQYLRYRGFPHKDRLHHVFYVHCDNDFDDLRHAGLYALNAAGELVRRMRGTSTWIRFLSGFRLTYLALDVWQRLAGGFAGDPAGGDLAGEEHDEAVHDGDVVFEAVLSRWRDEAEANGSAFHVVLLPVPGTATQFHRKTRSGLFDVLDLHDCFEQEIPGFVWKDWHFRSDSHWNEAGHMVAAHCLYRFLERRWGVARVPNEALAHARHDYYRAFVDAADWPGHRFMPSAPWALPAPGPLHPAATARIRAKHLALKKTDGEGQRRRIAREVRQGEPLVRKGGWAVYASLRHRMVVYVKSPCGKGGNDPAGRLFLHALAPGRGRTQRDWTELRLEDIAAFWRDGRDCVVVRPVGRYSPIAKLRTGEWRGAPGGAVLWEAEFPFDSEQREVAAAAAYRREYETFAQRRARVRPRGNWSVHLLDNAFAFLKEPCDAGDLRGRFFLHMYPVDPADAAYLNPGGSAVNYWRPQLPSLPRPVLWSGKYSRFVAVGVDGKCMLKATLPPWLVATISAGQENGEAVLWETTFHLNVERHRRAWAAVRGRAPLARNVFDIHRRGRELIYVRDPCDEGDFAARFFLQVYAGAAWQNLDFDFYARGVVTDGRCVAVARLPEQDIDRIRTGQFVAGEGELWSVEL